MRVESSSLGIEVQRQEASFKFLREGLRVISQGEGRKDIPLIPVRITQEPINLEVKSEAELKEFILKRLIEIMTGKEIETLSIEDITPDTENLEVPEFAMEYNREELRVEYKALRVYAYGEVRTSDGRNIKFSIELQLTDIEIEINSEKLRAGSLALIDPLIINLNSSPDIISDSSFSFDINSDGREETIPLLAKGKGFIFFDADGNGSVSDAEEIVGVKTGNAFKELSELDSDGNGWIDEIDPAFNYLKVWLKNEGVDEVKSLRELGIGALYTGSASTLFTLKSSAGKSGALLRNVGVFLYEDGRAGNLLKIDFLV